MRLLPAALMATLVIAVVATAFFVWPVVADAPWEDTGRPAPAGEDVSVPSGTAYETGFSTENTAGQPTQGGVSSDRTDCNTIRGTAYRSSSERRWYLDNCITYEPTGSTQFYPARPARPVRPLADPPSYGPASGGLDYTSGCNPASYATYDDYRCGGTGDADHTDGCNPAPYATYDDYRCGGTGDIERTEGCNPAPYATYDDYRCGGTGDIERTEGCNPAPYATYDDYRCGGN